MEELFALVRQIPPGRCCAYGDLGRALKNPVSGLIVGRWMHRCPDDLPWWRVIGADGRLPVGKRGPEFERLQRERLEAESVPFLAPDRVDLASVRWEF